MKITKQRDPRCRPCASGNFRGKPRGAKTMILRRLSTALRKQDWVTVLIETLIVMFGVFLGIQVSNWNEARQTHIQERAYLERLSADITESIAYFGAKHAESVHRNAVVKTFIEALDDPDTADADLTAASRAFIQEGWPVAYFQPTRITFDDLVMSGNLQIIQNAELREEIIRLHKYYDRTQDGFKVNVDWLLPNDSRIIYEYDALRWDPRTAELYGKRSTAEEAKDIREHAANLKRLAVSAFWFKDSALGHYDEAAVKSTAVKDRIDREISQ